MFGQRLNFFRRGGRRGDILRVYRGAFDEAAESGNPDVKIRAFSQVVDFCASSGLCRTDDSIKRNKVMYWTYNNLGDAWVAKTYQNPSEKNDALRKAVGCYREAVNVARDEAEKINSLQRIAAIYKQIGDVGNLNKTREAIVLTLGDEYDLVCPSEYMIMKLMSEDRLEPFSNDFYDKNIKENYYSRGVSPYIKNVFDDLKISGESLSRYGAGYMWGVMGLVYNPSAVSKEDVRHWSVLLDEKYRKQVTMKDSVRDSYLVALTILKEKKLLSEEFQKAMETTHCLTDELNDTSEQTVTKVQTILEKMRENSYSLETDSGKADMVTGKVVLNMQWSGDGVYTMDEAEKDGLELSYAVPEEGSNLWFDGFCMMKNGISGDAKKKQAAQAFINYISRPDNVIRNMYYVGYTSVIAGGDSNLIFRYADWCYGAEEDEEEVSPYDLSYFFSGAKETKNKYVLEVPKSQASRQVSAQYPEQSVLKRSAVMQCFSGEANRRISRMWIRVRCF